MHACRFDHRHSRVTIPPILCPVILLLTLGGCGFDAASLVPPTVSEDDSLPALDLNGTRFRVETAGDPTDHPV